MDKKLCTCLFVVGDDPGCLTHGKEAQYDEIRQLRAELAKEIGALTVDELRKILAVIRKGKR
jgi:hypothetical protein